MERELICKKMETFCQKLDLALRLNRLEKDEFFYAFSCLMLQRLRDDALLTECVTRCLRLLPDRDASDMLSWASREWLPSNFLPYPAGFVATADPVVIERIKQELQPYRKQLFELVRTRAEIQD